MLVQDRQHTKQHALREELEFDREHSLEHHNATRMNYTQFMKIVSVVGARPQFIKVSSISRSASSQGFEHYIINSGQHYDYEMAGAFFDSFNGSKSIVDLRVGSGSHAFQTGEILRKIEDEIGKINPDWLLVYGDTNTTLAAALFGAKANIKIAHIEAGLRSNDRTMPEEVNRVIVDHVSTLNFAPTHEAMTNLSREGLASTSRLVGDVMIDNLKFFSSHLAKGKKRSQDRILATLHRPSNVDNPERLQYLMEKLSNSKREIVIPAHPRLVKGINFNKIDYDSRVVKLISPVPYLEMLEMVFESKGVVTDSGGLQKEAFFLGIPSLTVRNTTEWPETLSEGMNSLDPDLLKLNEFIELTKETSALAEMVYGDGTAAEKILEAIRAF